MPYACSGVDLREAGGRAKDLDENVPDTRAARGWVPVAPHDAHGLVVQRSIVESVQGAFSCKDAKRTLRGQMFTTV